MKATIKGKTINIKPGGVIRRLDALGRISVPMEFRKVLGIKDGDEMEILPDYGAGLLVIRKRVTPEADT